MLVTASLGHKDRAGCSELGEDCRSSSWHKMLRLLRWILAVPERRNAWECAGIGRSLL
jgi:hypothetical protein